MPTADGPFVESAREARRRRVRRAIAQAVALLEAEVADAEVSGDFGECELAERLAAYALDLEGMLPW